MQGPSDPAHPVRSPDTSGQPASPVCKRLRTCRATQNEHHSKKGRLPVDGQRSHLPALSGHPHALPTLTTSMPSPAQNNTLGSSPPPTDQAAYQGGGERQLKPVVVPWPWGEGLEQKEKQSPHPVSFISSRRTAANTCSVGKPGRHLHLRPQMLFSSTNRETEVK